MSDSIPPASARNVRRKPLVAEPEVSKGTESTRPSAPNGVGERRESRAMRMAWSVLGTVLVIGIGTGVAWSARHYITTSPRFSVREIVVSGAQRRTEDQLSAEAGIEKGKNVFSIDLDKAREGLLADPWIETATLSRKLPASIVVRITEREAAALVVCGADTYLATREGTIIKRIEASDPTDLPIVTGLLPETFVTDREGVTATIRHALDLASDYEHSPLAARSSLQEVHVEPNGEMTLVIGKSTLALHMGSGPYRKKLERAVRVVAELDRRGAKAGEIMLDNEARPERVVVRMR